MTQGNEYHDVKGHFTDKANDGGACYHGDDIIISKKAEEKINKIEDKSIRENARKLSEVFGILDDDAKRKKAKELGFKYNARDGEFTKEIDISGLPFKPIMTILDFAPNNSYYETFFFKENQKKKKLSFDEVLSLSDEEREEYWKEPQTDFYSIDEIKEYYEKAKESTSKTSKQKNDYKNASDEEKVKMMMKKDFDPSMFLSDSKITSGIRIGGYVGQSMSKSAEASEEMGSLPLSRWNKTELFGRIEDEKNETYDPVIDLKPYLPLLKKIPMKDLKNIMLYKNGWHHTGKFYNQTDFYGIDSPRNIVNRLKDYLNFHEGVKKGLGV